MARNLRPCQRQPLAAACSWITSLCFALDGMGLWMTMLTGILFPATLVTSAMFLLLLLETLVTGTLTILDLIGFYALFEASLIPMFLLIADGGSAWSKVGAAYRIVTYTMAGSLVMLPMVFLIYDATEQGDSGPCVAFFGLFVPSGTPWTLAPVFAGLETVSYCFRAISLGYDFGRTCSPAIRCCTS
jgi:formate hydrogenlyase subunit 3/multisubunit Na+/H+ antiporter MnhD subunit